MTDCYVYVYIDPRNNEEFYYGKGQGSRKEAHLTDASDSAKAKRIQAIRKEGLEPTIRVIARGLTESEALLVEKTLLWKLGKLTTNVSSGHFGDKFRPADTLHKPLPGFDFRNGIYYYNVGQGIHRQWDDYIKFNFISAGQGARWRDAICGFNVGDVALAYLKRHGFVGVARIKSRAQMIRSVHVDGRPLLSLPLKCPNMADNCENDELSEYVCLVEWLAAVPSSQAKWRASPRLYTTTHVRASLEAQRDTLAFVEQAFGISINDAIA